MFTYRHGLYAETKAPTAELVFVLSS